jgi:hypothetical protein
MDFGDAIRALKAGQRVSRPGWNGKGMWLAYQKGYPDGIAINANTAADGDFVPWLASQSDILAEDWETVAWEQIAR